MAKAATAADGITPLHYGDSDSNTATFLVETLWNAESTNLFFNPAPYDWFYTPHSLPQVKVKVDGVLGACEYSATTSCDYKREAGTPKLTGTTSPTPFT